MVPYWLAATNRCRSGSVPIKLLTNKFTLFIRLFPVHTSPPDHTPMTNTWHAHGTMPCTSNPRVSSFNLHWVYLICSSPGVRVVPPPFPSCYCRCSCSGSFSFGSGSGSVFYVCFVLRVTGVVSVSRTNCWSDCFYVEVLGSDYSSSSLIFIWTAFFSASCRRLSHS